MTDIGQPKVRTTRMLEYVARAGGARILTGEDRGALALCWLSGCAPEALVAYPDTKSRHS